MCRRDVMGEKQHEKNMAIYLKMGQEAKILKDTSHSEKEL